MVNRLTVPNKKAICIAVLLTVLSGGVLSRNEDNDETLLKAKLLLIYNEMDKRFNLKTEELVLIVDGNKQRMYLVDGGNGLRINKAYSVSTGKAGFGNEAESNRTPTGAHRIKEKYGDNVPAGTIFQARRNTGKTAVIYTDRQDLPDDPIVSRIMWLDGCDKNNKNSHSRFIYIHGTAEEGLIGTPASKGCIRMKNKDVIELYGLVSPGTYVYILK
jgi:lipoprotein-anchoring transpeptidase ErfK/SrfK